MLAVVKRIERIRLYPTTRQAAALAVMLDVTRDLYNALLQQRRDAYRLRRVTLTPKMQYAEVTALRAEDGRLRAVYREAEDAVLHRLDLAMAAVFRRCKRGEIPGFPRFKGRRRWQQRGIRRQARYSARRITGGSSSLQNGGRSWADKECRMTKRVIRIALSAFVFLICGCSAATSVPSVTGQAPQAPLVKGKSAQYLYVYNLGSPGLYYAERVRYSLPDLALQETTEADGAGSPTAFGPTGLPFFVDEAPQGAYAVFLQPLKSGAVPAKEQFYGVPCVSSSLAAGPTGNFYAVQYCSGNVLEFSAGAEKGKAKKPIATYAGGNLTGDVLPTYATVDPKGDLYVGDNGGGVTYFAAKSTKGAIAFATGQSQAVTQMVVDSHGNVWSTHYPNPTTVYFKNKTTCVPDPSGSIKRFEGAEEFSKGALVKQLYSSTTDSPVYAAGGLSVAVDSSGRVYIGTQNSSDAGVLVDYDPNRSCPNDGLSFVLPTRAFPQVAVDKQRRFYVTDYNDNTISAYEGGSKKLLKRITQETGVVDISSTAINP